MNIVVIGVNHRTAPLDMLERVSLAGETLRKASMSLMSRSNLSEVVILSTCNRTEVYAVAERYHGAHDDVCDVLCEVGGLRAAELRDHLYVEHDALAVRHLFAVAAGLESAVLGESEILGQVRRAWESARLEGTARGRLNLLFRHALETGKRARTETTIGQHTASVSHAAVEMAAERLGSLAGRRALVVGAGAMGDGVAMALGNADADVVVVNRTESRARELADRVGGRAVALSALPAEAPHADIIVTCAGAGSVLIDRDLVDSCGRTADNPLLIIDIAVPRDVAPDVASCGVVTLLNLDDLREWAAKGVALREAEAQRVRDIVDDEVGRHELESLARQAAPLVAQLHERAESVRRSELERLSSRLSSLDDSERAAVDALTRGIIAKLLHRVSVGLKDDAGTPRGERNAAAVRDLFDLD